MAIVRTNPGITIRELSTVAELERAIQLEKEVWRCEDSDIVPITLAVATRAAGSIWLGAFEGVDLIGDLGSRYASELVDKLKDKPPSDTAEWQGLCCEQWCQPALDLCSHKSLQTLPYLFARIALDKAAA